MSHYTIFNYVPNVLFYYKIYHINNTNGVVKIRKVDLSKSEKKNTKLLKS